MKNMVKSLRPYQQEALDNLKRRLKETTHPLLLNISVGGGKSLIIAELLLWLERFNFRALCLTLNSTLIKQNADTYKLQGGHSGIYCAGLKSKAYEELVIFASPHSICQGIKKKNEISRQPFNLIIVDEAHNINPVDDSSMFMRINNHYGRMAQEEQYSFRVVGLTGTPFRGKNVYIVGDDQFFKEEVATISISWLIEKSYLTRPTFGLTHVDAIDFSQLRVENTGKFNHKDLQKAVSKDGRLTAKIMRELVSILERGNHHGAFIFAATIAHCYECYKALPAGQAAVITGDTPHVKRQKILLEAKEGTVKYIISVNCCMVGIDVPPYDISCWCRLTESLIIFTQGIGRVLRLSPGKSRALILDYAGNLDRHGELDNPIINEGLKQLAADDADYCIPCYTCNTNNKVTARRCIAFINEKRCDHYFEWKNCPSCSVQNDITSRYCRGCALELIDPNAKLALMKDPLYELRVNSMNCSYSFIANGILIEIIFHCTRLDIRTKVYQNYVLVSPKSLRFFYGSFMKVFFGENYSYWNKLELSLVDKKMAENFFYFLFFRLKPKEPTRIVCKRDQDLNYKYKSALFC